MHVDFLILTALKDELDALLALHQDWVARTDQFDLPYHHLLIPNREGHVVSVAAAWCGDMGEAAAATRAAALVAELKPGAIGMCGICAGKRGDTTLGDVIVAERVYSYDHGKVIAHTSPGGERVEDFFQDITTYNLPLDWKMNAAYLAAEFGKRPEVANARPLALEAQRTWLLRALEMRDTKGAEEPFELPDRASCCPNWAKAVASLEKAQLITVSGGLIAVSALGSEFARNHRARHPGWVPENGPFRMHSAAVATGKTVREDAELFGRLERAVRKTLGVEMEGAAIGHVGRYANIPTIIVKAVSDHADEDKDDSYRAFACTVSAKFLLEFVTGHLGPGDGSAEKKLATLTARWRDDVKDQLGGALRLPRAKSAAELRETRGANRTVVVLGESGAGKSALVKDALSDSADVFAAHADELVLLDQDEMEAFVRTRRSHSTLIVDAAERLVGEADCRALARVIRAMRLDSDTPWRLILTCQTLQWSALKERLERTEFPWGTRATVLTTPVAADELAEVSKAFPTLAQLLARGELEPLTTQMKVLDLLCRAAADGDLPATERWVGESNFIDWYWDQYFRREGRGDAHVAAVQILARDQADAHRFATPLSSVRSSDTALLSALNAAGVITKRGDIVRFAHDVYADYARARYLLTQLRAEQIDELHSRVSNPLWHRAFRLLGLHLLEGHPGDPAKAVSEWSQLCEILGAGGRQNVAFDLLVDAIPIAAAPERLLEQLWPELAATEGLLLRRFLLRFLYGTTVPHPTILDGLRSASPEARALAEVRWRQPNVWLWAPVLRWIVKHGDEIVALAPEELLAIVEPWLLGTRAYPKFPLRDELTALVFRLAEEVGRPTYWRARVEDAERLYSVLMATGHYAPDRFRAVLRRYAGMEKEPEPKPTDESGVPDDQLYLLRRIVPTERVGPWPGGPVADSNDGFAKVVLKDPAAAWLVEFDAELARDIFLALLIEPPHERTFGDLRRDHCELRHPELDFKPTHMFAPVRHLLSAAPDIGRGMVNQLAEFATERWLEALRAHPSSHGSGKDDRIELAFDDGPREYFGPGDPLHWHLAGSNGPKPLVAVLMTFEQWLYAQLEENKLEDALLTEIVRSARSVAVLGVCLEIALRVPGTLRASLEPLATSAEILITSRGRWMLTRQPLLFTVSRESHEFVKMEHRANDFLRVAVYVFAKTGLDWPAMEAARQRWLAGLGAMPEGRFRDWIEQLVAQFDPMNWKRATAPDGETTASYEPPRELTAKSAAGLAALEQSMALQAIPLRCRRIIDGEEEIDDVQLETLLKQVADVSSLPEDTDWMVGGARGLRCAVGAVALLRFSEWIDEHSDWRQKCVAWVREALTDGPRADERSNRVDARDWTWDVFAAEVVASLLAADTTNPDLRSAAAALVSFPHDITVQRFFRSAELQLPERTFSELLHLGVLFAAAAQGSAPWEPAPVRSSAFDEKARAFVAGKLEPLPADWSRRGGEHGFDEGYLSLAFGWVGSHLRPGEPTDARIASIVLSFASLLLTRLDSSNRQHAALVLAPRESLVALLRRWTNHVVRWCCALFAKPVTPKKRTRRRRHDNPVPYEADRVVLGWLTRIAVNERGAERRRMFWEPWMRLPLDCEHFIETFLEDIYRAGLDDGAPFFADVLLEIAAFQTRDGWLQRGNGLHASRVAAYLLGRGHFRPMADRWAVDRTAVAIACRKLWEDWLGVAYDWHGCLAAFSDLLCTPAFSTLRVDGMTWLKRYDLERALRDTDAQDALARVLETVVAEQEKDLAQTAQARAALEHLLEALVSRGNKRAIVLNAKLAVTRSDLGQTA